MNLPSVTDLADLPRDKQAAAIGLLFEPCETLVDLVLPAVHDAASWSALIEHARVRLHSLDPADPRTSQIIAAHPRLGAKKIDSAQSQAEQASLGNESEAAVLAHWNAEYERQFPGLRYVVFVAGRPRSEVLEDMKCRIAENNFAIEVRRAFDAMCDIALDRQKKLNVDVKTRI